jgi:hypothetical protein
MKIKEAWLKRDHFWSECDLCGPMVICGNCGNNCCNGGFGTLSDGSACSECESAYDKQNAEYPKK